MVDIFTLFRSLRQRGQALVELAFALPLFLMMLFCIIYGGWVFTDYMTFSSIARNCVTEASTNCTFDANGENPDFSRAIANTVNNNTNSLRSGAFVWKPDDSGNGNHYLDVVADEDNSTTNDPNPNYRVTVYINADLDTENSYLGQMAYNLISFTSGKGQANKKIKDFIHIEYTMFLKNPNNL